MNFKKISFLLLGVVLISVMTDLIAQNKSTKPRVIAMTDGEVDDRSSMVRFLMYTCDFDLLAIIETNSIFQKWGHSNENWLEKELDAYEQVYPNLIKHNTNYPNPEYLKSVCYVGDENYNHLKDLERWSLIPGAKVTYEPDEWEDTPGSDKIVEVLLEDNPDPVYIQAWGGGNTAARAFYKLKTVYPDEYVRAVSKVVMYNIWYQDGAGNYIEKYHSKVTMLYCGSFAGTWNYNSQKNTYDFIAKNVKDNHGPLGALYPQDYISEGDSPSFLYCVVNGLRNHEDPTYGGWGGRFTKFEKLENVYTDAEDDGDIKKSLRRWVDDANRDFQARMDWCVNSEFNEANHPPVAIINEENNLSVKSGKKVKLDAGKSNDPDGDEINFSWFQYKGPGSFNDSLEILNARNSLTSFVAPEVRKPETIHLLLKVTDNGSPSLCSYRRLIITVLP